MHVSLIPNRHIHSQSTYTEIKKPAREELEARESISVFQIHTNHTRDILK